MAINKAMRLALKALSFDGVNDYKLRRAANEIKAPHAMKPLYQRWDHIVINGLREVPVRIYPAPKNAKSGIILFFHGGGWVTESVNTYNNVCMTMANKLRRKVISVEYGLAPEHPFPEGLNDCYAVAEEIFKYPQAFGINSDEVYLIGDSAGGNLAAAVSMMARDKGSFSIKNQVLIYPVTYNDHSENSPFKSVKENGSDYLLTAGAVMDYMSLYVAKAEDYKNPYVAPLLAKSFKNLPRTLIISAEFCPLRDEGEELGRVMLRAGNDVTIYRMKDALHGFFSMNYRFVQVKRAYEQINKFIDGQD